MHSKGFATVTSKKRPQHIDDIRLKKDTCRAHQHMVNAHSGIMPKFQMNVTRVYGKDSMLRQILEAIRIRHANSEPLMNKSEWNTQMIPQVVIERS